MRKEREKEKKRSKKEKKQRKEAIRQKNEKEKKQKKQKKRRSKTGTTIIFKPPPPHSLFLYGLGPCIQSTPELSMTACASGGKGRPGVM